MARALTVSDLINKKYKLFEFDGEWYEAFKRPEKYGVWFIWGQSGNGKSTFVLMLLKYLTRFGKVLYDSMEEAAAHTMQEAYIRTGMMDVDGKILLLERESIEDLDRRLSKQRSADIVAIDSFQYSGLNWDRYKKLKEKYPHKLFIFISHADGKEPEGRPAKRVHFDATLKIRVEGYRAISKGRYIGPNGGIFTIWPEGAAKYWGE